MNEAIEYVLGVVVIPAVVAAVVALPCLFNPLRRREALVDAGLAAALALAFLLSFVSELDWRAVARQVATIEGDDAPFERWHRLGLVAAALVPGAVLVSVRRWRRPAPLAGLFTVSAAIAAAVATAVFVQFPGSSPSIQVAQGVLVLASVLAWTVAGQAVLWSAWSVFGALAALAGLGGFASLAVMCGAMSVCAFLLASLEAVAGRRATDATREPIHARGALSLVLGVMGALIARCGMAYDTLGVSPALWTAAALLPLGGMLFAKQFRATERRALRTFWRWIGTALLALALLGSAAALQGGGGSSDDGGGDDLSDMYGG